MILRALGPATKVLGHGPAQPIVALVYMASRYPESLTLLTLAMVTTKVSHIFEAGTQ